MPEELYHYTNIESLALILKNRTIRFNSLDKMDDLQETMTADVENAGRFTYVSCWTADVKENIALWKQYTNHDTGVRIELPKYPFKKYDFVKSIIGTKLKNIDVPVGLQTIIDYNHMLKSDYFTQIVSGDDILYQVKYTDDINEIIPKILDYNALTNQTTVKMGLLGKCKDSAWSYQKEWRYILQFIPGNLLQALNDGFETFAEGIKEICNGTAKQPFPYYDLKISDEAFKRMKIVLSPTISLGNEILIRSTIGQYNPNAQISDSKFKGKIR